MRKASVSMSKRAPRGWTVPVRRATRPSTASRTRATEANATSRPVGSRAPAGSAMASADEGRDAAGQHRPRQGDAISREEVTARRADEPGAERGRTAPRRRRGRRPSRRRPRSMPWSKAASRASTPTSPARGREGSPDARAPPHRRGLPPRTPPPPIGVHGPPSVVACPPMRGRTGWSSPAGARSGRSRARAGAGEVLVRALHSGVSRGTETTSSAGPSRRTSTPSCVHRTRRATSPAPVKYGYLGVGIVEEGPSEIVGRTVFCLHPHQTAYVVPVDSVVVVPDEVPARRAVLAGTVETAVNALWDGAPRVGDRVAVVGAGMVGCCVARLLAGIPGCRVTLVDVDPARAAVAARLGVAFARPDDLAPRAGTTTSSSTRARPGRPPALARPPRAGGDRARPQLVRRLAGRAVPRRVVPLLASAHPCEPGGFRCAARRSRYTYAQRWPSRSTCCATPPSTPCSPATRRSRSCPTSCRGSRTAPCRPSATPSPTDPPTETGSRCSA